MNWNLTLTGVIVTAVTALASAVYAQDRTADAKQPVGPDKVVYHVSDTETQASSALLYIRNHLEVNPKAKIVVVTHARGVEFLLEGAKNKTGNPYNIPVEEFHTRGVRFEVCEITVREMKLKRSQFIPEATFVPSGVAEITRLQQREGYAYLRP